MCQTQLWWSGGAYFSNRNIKQSTMKNFESSTAEATSTQQYPEGPAATPIQRQPATLRSDLFLWAAGGSIATSLTLKIMGRRHDALFVGQWAPTFLLLGLYSKLVKLFGTEPQRGSSPTQ